MTMPHNKEDFVLFYSTSSVYSNFHPADFRDQALMRMVPDTSSYHNNTEFTFSHVEQYMHACKALLFKDIVVLDKILSTTDPQSAKRLGRQVANFEDKLWSSAARAIVTRGCWLKFSQNEELGLEMRNTGDRAFVECAPNDIR